MNSISTKKNEKPKRERTLFREYFELFAEVLVLVFFINSFLLQTYAIPTPSMEDNMMVGDHILVDKITYTEPQWLLDRVLPQKKINRGDIVTFKSPPEVEKGNEAKMLYVKRVIALPGDTLQLKNNLVYVNGRHIPESYVFLRGDELAPVNFPPPDGLSWDFDFPEKFHGQLERTDEGLAFKVPEGYLFCMGDNRNLSSDCRDWGPVPRDYVIGKPWLNYWSYESTTSDYLSPGIKNKIKSLLSTFVHFFSRTRWERTLRGYK